MSTKNTKDSYGSISKVFHWSIAVLILSIILVGLYMGDLPNTPDKFQIYALHKSFGLLVLWLAGLRVLWLIHTKPPESNKSHQKWEKILSKIIHFFLYFSMFALPLSGWVMSSAGDYPVPFFGLQMPDIVAPNKEIGEFAHEAHEVIAYLLMAAIGLHVAGALKHNFIDGDNTLIRMLPDVFQKSFRVLVIFLLAIFVIGVFKFSILEQLNEKEDTEVEVLEGHEESKLQKKN